LSSLKANEKAARITQVCDVDGNYLNSCGCDAEEMGEAATPFEGLSVSAEKQKTWTRSRLRHRSLAHADGVAGFQAGKTNVYVEKAVQPYPAEGAMLVAAQKKYGPSWCRWGRKQRSSRQRLK